MINKYDFEKDEIPKREVLMGFSLFLVLFAANHEIIYNSVRKIT